MVLAGEHYNLVVRLLEQEIPVTLAVEVAGTYQEDRTEAYNIIAEITGVDPEIGDEIVMVGAHLDSWHSGTGATDNADGSSIVMEALRILKALDVRPRRTIRSTVLTDESGSVALTLEPRFFQRASNCLTTILRNVSLLTAR